MGKEVIKNTKFKKQNPKVNNLENKIPDATTLICINQYSTDKKSFEKKNGDVNKKIPIVSGLVTTTVLNEKISEAESKSPVTSGLVTTSVLNTKIGEVEKEIPDVSDLVKKTDSKAEISNIEVKYFTNSDYNTFTKEILDAKIKEKGLVNKSGILTSQKILIETQNLQH